jgi:hypothetical protein
MSTNNNSGFSKLECCLILQSSEERCTEYLARMIFGHKRIVRELLSCWLYKCIFNNQLLPKKQLSLQTTEEKARSDAVSVCMEEIRTYNPVSSVKFWTKYDQENCSPQQQVVLEKEGLYRPFIDKDIYLDVNKLPWYCIQCIQALICKGAFYATKKDAYGTKLKFHQFSLDRILLDVFNEMREHLCNQLSRLSQRKRPISAQPICIPFPGAEYQHPTYHDRLEWLKCSMEYSEDTINQVIFGSCKLVECHLMCIAQSNDNNIHASMVETKDGSVYSVDIAYNNGRGGVHWEVTKETLKKLFPDTHHNITTKQLARDLFKTYIIFKLNQME